MCSAAPSGCLQGSSHSPRLKDFGGKSTSFCWRRGSASGSWVDGLEGVVVHKRDRRVGAGSAYCPEGIRRAHRWQEISDGQQRHVRCPRLPPLRVISVIRTVFSSMMNLPAPISPKEARRQDSPLHRRPWRAWKNLAQPKDRRTVPPRFPATHATPAGTNTTSAGSARTASPGEEGVRQDFVDAVIQQKAGMAQKLQLHICSTPLFPRWDGQLSEPPSVGSLDGMISYPVGKVNSSLHEKSGAGLFPGPTPSAYSIFLTAGPGWHRPWQRSPPSHIRAARCRRCGCRRSALDSPQLRCSLPPPPYRSCTAASWPRTGCRRWG